MRIVGAGGESVPDGRVGDLSIRTPSLMRGYYDDEAASADVLQDGWLRTGDIGYLRDGELRLVARKKDLIIIGGRNVAPQDVEHVAMTACVSVASPP